MRLCMDARPEQAWTRRGRVHQAFGRRQDPSFKSRLDIAEDIHAHPCLVELGG